jgi:hypothetical protein
MLGPLILGDVDIATALKNRRTACRVSQLELALRAGTTQRHLPYPAIVIDRYGEIIAANAAQEILAEGAVPQVRSNAYRLALHPQGMAPRIVNFAEWARHVVDNIAAALARNPDERLAALHAELSDYVPPARPGAGHLGFAVPLQLRSSRGELRLMTTITTFATAVDVTVSELRLEAFLPADASTAAALMS